MEKQRLDISGMDCTNCALTIKKVMEKQGATDVSVNFTTGEAAFVFENDIQKIVSSVSDLGYGVKIVEKEKIHHDHAHEEDKGFFRIQNILIICAIFTFPLLLHMFVAEDSILNNPVLQLILSTPVYIIGCFHFGRSAWGSIKVMMPNMDVLIFIGASAAYIYSIAGAFFLHPDHAHHYLYFETAATIITLVLTGNWIEHLSVQRTTSAIGELSKLQKTKAKLYSRFSEGGYLEVDIKDVQINDTVMVSEGEQIPVDGIVSDGECYVDEAMISGESVPVLKKKGDHVIGGTLCKEGNFRFVVNRVGKDTTLQQIIALVKSAQENQPKIQKIGDKVSAIFVPVVLGISLLTFIITYFLGYGSEVAVMNSIAVLVISCPCAMGLATPTAVMVGIGVAAKQGILIKGGNTIEMLSEIKCIVFDKTGTLTTGEFKIENLSVVGAHDETLVKNLLYSIESQSTHPIAKSICKELKSVATFLSLQNIKEIRGVGISATYNNQEYKIEAGGKAGEIFLFEDTIKIASLSIKDDIKNDAIETITWLKKQGITPILLSGDKKESCESVAHKIGIETVYSEQKPEDKLRIIEQLNAKSKTAMVGDGINDAPALAKAFIGISLGGASDVAKKSAQVILLNNNSLKQVQQAIALGKITLRTIKQNLFWALFYNVIAIPIAAVGLLMPMFAAITMAFSDVFVIGNSLRIKTKTLI